MRKFILAMLVTLSAFLPAYSQQRHRAAAPGAEMKALNPDISAVVETRLVFSEDKSISGRDEIRLDDIELVFQAYVYPGVFGNVVLEIEEDDGDWELEAEEAYLTFYELPWGLQADVGRKFVDFGRLNPVHGHDWLFASRPLAYQNIFGGRWSEDGLQVSKLIPNPWNKYINLRLGWWSGNPVDDSNSYTGRLTTNLFYEQTHDAMAGFSIARDSDGDNTLYGFDLTYRKRWPFTQRRFRWQNEVFATETDNGSASGFYSLAQLSLNNYWDVGFRYDWTEILDDDDTEWAASVYATHRFSETVYLRPELRYHEGPDGEGKSTLMLQFVWGFGPHAHPLED